MVTTHLIAEAPSKDAVRRLAQYRPFDEGGRSVHAMLRDLVLAATAINGGTFEDLEACRAAFNDLWRLDVEIDELRTTRDALQADKQIDTRGRSFTLTSKARLELEQRAAESSANESQALADWHETLRNIRPDLTEVEFRHLCDDLREWLHTIIVRHGIEAALLLYPEETRAHSLFEKIDKVGTDGLAKRTGLVALLREDALRLFVRNATPAQRRFLSNRLNTAFYLTVLTLDPGAKALTRASAQGRRIYLDTNVLFAVLGKADATEVASTHRLLTLTKDLGIQLAITPWTVAELRMSIQTARRSLELQRIRPELAPLMLATSGEKGYGAAFWRDFQKTGMRPSDWFERAEHFEHDLESLGIDVVSDGCTAVDQSTNAVRDYALLLDRMLGATRERHGDVLEHDAKHRLLIERLRGSDHQSFSTAHFWFLTEDNQLPRFAAEMPDPDTRSPHLPFCISPSLWMQIMRALTPRTDDFEDTVVTLLTSPYVGWRTPVDQRAVREVVARIDTYEHASPELALAVLQDSALVRTISESSERDIEQRVRAAYSTKTKELQEQARVSANEAAAERLRREAAEARERDTVLDLEAEKRRREGAETDLDRERRLRERSEQELRQLIEETRKSATEALAAERARRELFEQKVAKSEQKRQRIRRVVIGIAIALLGIVIPVACIRLQVVVERLPLRALVSASVVVLLIGVRVVLGAARGAAILNWIIGGVTIVGALISADIV